MVKFKIILAAIGAALLFILGIFTGRAGRHNDIRVDRDIESERELAAGLHDIDGDISGELKSTREEIDGVAAKDKTVRNRIRRTQSIIDRVKKRNGLG